MTRYGPCWLRPKGRIIDRRLSKMEGSTQGKMEQYRGSYPGLPEDAYFVCLPDTVDPRGPKGR